MALQRRDDLSARTGICPARLNRKKQQPRRFCPSRLLFICRNVCCSINHRTILQYKRRKTLRLECFLNWWEVVDSNHRSHRRQIYSLFPLATRETSHIKLSFAQKVWSWWTDLNPRPADYKSAALPTELHQRLHPFIVTDIILAYQETDVNRFFDKIFQCTGKEHGDLFLRNLF